MLKSEYVLNNDVCLIPRLYGIHEETFELSGLFNARIFYIFQAVRRAVNVLNVCTCI